ncbi:unnamed protein product [Lupinus luteus]|uniref:Diacylglycerol kinase n=1 Tax=Lupinus luteus TaxID=3873 RepID=A0AAV1W733_LUPLU
MDSPSSSSITSDKIVTVKTAPSLVDSFRGCGISSVRVDKEELRQNMTMPEYLRFAIRDCIRFKDTIVCKSYCIGGDSMHGDEKAVAPKTPMVVFINPRSGGRHGPVLKERLQHLMSEEQVFDLLEVKPHEFIRYGLGCLDTLAALGDTCAKETRERIRIVVAGGDGSVGWILGCLTELHTQGLEPVPPVAIIPLGTGNDLSRSFGWGGSFPFSWKAAIKRTLYKASIGPICRLDSWKISLSMAEGTTVEPPYSLKQTEEYSLDESLEVEGELPDKVICYEGVFYNYFSIGMDAQVAYGFHHLRNEKPYLAQGPIANKIIYSGYTCTQGWFLSPCSGDPSLRGLKNILRMHVKRFNSSEWEQVPVPTSVRAVVALNLHSYGSGRNPWGNLKPEYLEKATAIRLEVRGGEWKDAYMQMDGEPWKQPLNKDHSTFVEIKREPFQSYMVNGE